MVKVVRCLIEQPTLVDFIRENIKECKNCNNLIITNVEVSGCDNDEIEFEAIVTNEAIGRGHGVRFILE